MPNYDYSQQGAYFITICCYERQVMFGEIVQGQMIHNDAGLSVQKCWHEIPEHFPMAYLDEFIIMPNHMHGIIVIPNRRGTACRAQGKNAACMFDQNTIMEYSGTACRAPTGEQFGKPIKGSIATIIRSFKSASTKSINTMQNTPGSPIWQRNYWERVIRTEQEMQSVRQYIRCNPVQWQHDDLKDL
jgi:putative transposase